MDDELTLGDDQIGTEVDDESPWGAGDADADDIDSDDADVDADDADS
jgi:hypothetical protein